MSAPLDLDAIRRRAEEATPGPWGYALTGEKDNSWAVGSAADDNEAPLSGCLNDWEDETGLEYVVVDGVCEGIDGSTADAAFIAHAREDVPCLLHYIEELHAEIARLRGSSN